MSERKRSIGGGAVRTESIGRVIHVHPYAWVWETIESDPSFVLGSMFGTRVAYLDGKLTLCFTAKTEPWRGILVCTDRCHHASLIAEFPSLSPHPVLGKWLYLAESANDFERSAERLSALSRQRDPRIGVSASPKRGRRN
jgi:hypothetical protein